MQRSSVDLPAPEGPIMQTTLPGRHIEVDAFQHLDAAEALVQAVDLDHGGRAATAAGRVPGPFAIARTRVHRVRCPGRCGRAGAR